MVSEGDQGHHGQLVLRPRKPPNAAHVVISAPHQSDRASNSSARAGSERQFSTPSTATFPTSNESSSRESDYFAGVHPTRRSRLPGFANSPPGPRHISKPVKDGCISENSDVETPKPSEVEERSVKHETVTPSPYAQEVDALFDARAVTEALEIQRLKEKREQEERERSLTINGKPLFGPLTLAQMIDAHYEVLMRRPLPGANKGTDEKHGEYNGKGQLEAGNAEDDVMED
ncbi:hypothetical protein F4779DRAFT_623077 [Xylariaceae sp. FL0662B]|nr:hypothetical protein F4779DRAFT_623077 [Xylariaceae sp. FL0662B]